MAMEGTLAAAPDRRVDPEVDLVDEPVPDQVVGQLAAAEREQVAPVPSLDAGNALGQVARDQGGVPGERLGEGPGGDVLGQAVGPLGEARVVGDCRPVAGEALVDLAPEQKRVGGEELIVFVPFALALEDRPGSGVGADDAVDGDVSRMISFPIVTSRSVNDAILNVGYADRPCSGPELIAQAAARRLPGSPPAPSPRSVRSGRPRPPSR
jgi:hypothetical protein